MVIYATSLEQHLLMFFPLSTARTWTKIRALFDFSLSSYAFSADSGARERQVFKSIEIKDRDRNFQ